LRRWKFVGLGEDKKPPFVVWWIGVGVIRLQTAILCFGGFGGEKGKFTPYAPQRVSLSATVFVGFATCFFIGCNFGSRLEVNDSTRFKGFATYLSLFK